MIKVVFDTNTYVSAILQPKGLPSKLLEITATAKIKTFDIYISSQIIDEIYRVLFYPRLRDKYNITDERINIYIAFIKEICVNIGYISEIFIVPDDPDDSYIVSTAIACKADFLVSGDKAHILSLGKVENVKIVSVREFYEIIKEK